MYLNIRSNPSKGRKKKSKLTPAAKEEISKLVDKKIKNSNEENHRAYAIAAECNTTVAITDLSALISQGDGYNERIGDELRMRSFEIRGRVAPKSTGAGDTVRIMLVQWKLPTTPASVDLFEDLATNGPTNSPYIVDELARSNFKVLMDKTFLVPAYAQINNRRDLYFSRTIKGSRISKVLFDAGATTGKNHIYIVYVGTQATGTTASNMYVNMVQNYSG